MTKDKNMLVEAYASGVLNPEVHARLVADLDGFARDAGITKNHIWTSLHDTLTDTEIAYLKAYRRHASANVAGLVLSGKERDGHASMAAIAGFLVRNFIRARVVTVSSFIDNGPFNDISAVLIPNFYLGKVNGGDLASWKVSAMLDHLYARRLAGLQTFLYVSDKKAMGIEYGSAIAQFLDVAFKSTR